MGASENNLENLTDEQIDSEIQDDKETTEPSDTQDSGEETFTDVTLEDINRDDLTPEMQAVYDEILERSSNMHGDYTRKTQEIAQARRDAEAWQAVTSNPEIARHLNEDIYKLEHGIPLDGSQDISKLTQQEAQIPDMETDPEGFLDHKIETGLRKVLGEVMPGIQEQMKQMSGFVQNEQANLEFENLANKYPSVKAIGALAIKRVQSQHLDQSGRPVSMEKALGIMAIDNPALLSGVKATASSNKQTVQTRKPAVEQSRTGRGSSSTTPALPLGAKGLQKRIADLRANGTLGLRNVAGRVMGKLANLGPEE